MRDASSRIGFSVYGTQCLNSYIASLRKELTPMGDRRPWNSFPNHRGLDISHAVLPCSMRKQLIALYFSFGGGGSLSSEVCTRNVRQFERWVVSCEGMRIKRSWPDLDLIPVFDWDHWGRPRMTYNMNSRCLGRGSIPSLPEYETAALPFCQCVRYMTPCRPIHILRMVVFPYFSIGLSVPYRKHITSPLQSPTG
jgi:hypothetical protein